MTATNWQGLDGAVPTSVTGNAAARTVTIVLSAAQNTLAETLTIVASAQLVNRTTVGAGLTINVAATGQTAADTNAFAVTAGAPSLITLTGPATVAANVASTNFTITMRDAFSNVTNVTQNTTFTLASNTAGTATFNPVSPVTITTGTSTVTFTYTDTMAGVGKTITATRASGDAIALPATANIDVTGGASSDANLSALNLSGATLSPTFLAVTITYSAVVANGTASTTVTATTANGGATVTINGVGGASRTLALTLGVNTITVLVTAQDTTTTKTYTVSVIRENEAPASEGDQGVYCDTGFRFDPFAPGGGKCVPDVTQQLPVTKLVITQQPAAPGDRNVSSTYTRVAAFAPLSPTLKVEGRDASDRLVAGYATPITATCFYNGPVDPSPTAKQGLVGTPMTMTPAGGVATFTGFSCPKGLDGGDGYFYVSLSTGATQQNGLTVYSNDFIVTPGTERACPADTFSVNGQCVPATVCDNNQYEFTPPTSTTDRTCRNVRTCAFNEVEVAAPTRTTNRICRAAPALSGVSLTVSPTTPDAEATMTVAFTQTTALQTGDTITVNLSDFVLTTGTIPVVKGLGFDVATSLSGEVSGARVVIKLATGELPANTAGTLTFTVRNPGAARTIAKAGLTVATSRVTTAVASSSDIIIAAAALTVCRSTEYESVAPTSTSDRRCSPLTVCSSEQIEATAPTATSDRVCSSAVATRIVVATPISLGSDGTSATVTFGLEDANGNNASVSTDTFRAIVLGSATSAPTAAAVIAGTGVLGTPPAKAALTGARMQSVTLNGLTASTAYKVYVAVEGLGLVSAGVDFTTAAPVTGLTSLALSGATLSPTFAPGTLTYTATVGAGVASVNLLAVTPKTANTGTLTDFPGMHISETADPTTGRLLESRAGTNTSVSAALPLVAGANTFSVFWSPSTGGAKTYTVTITRGDARVCVNGGTLQGNFCSCPTGYSGASCQISTPTIVCPAGQTATLSISATGTTTAICVCTNGRDTATGQCIVPVAKLAFSPSNMPPANATVGTSFAFTIETRNASNAVEGTSAVTLTADPAGLTGPGGIPGITASAVNGIATFTGLRFASAGTYTVTASATGFTSISTKITVQAPVGPATKLVIINRPTTASNRRSFSQPIQVEVQDAAGNGVRDSGATVTLAVKSGVATLGPASALSQPAIAGVATFTGVYLEGEAGDVTITATSGTLTEAPPTKISLTRAFAYYAFSKVPAYEVSGIAFGTQPVVNAYDTGGAILTSHNTTITLTVAAITGNLGSAVLGSASNASVITVEMRNGVATFNGVKATTTTAGSYVLTAAGTTGGSVATKFDLYTTAAAAATAQAKEIAQSKTFTFKLGVDSSILTNAALKSLTEASLRSDLCLAANQTLATCNILVELKAARATPPSDIVRAAQVAPANDNIITLTAPTLESVERLLGPAPSGTSILGVIGLSGRTPQGDVMYGPSRGPLQLTLMVAASQVLPGALAGDLKAAGWNSETKRWEFIPSRSVRNSDGSFSITTEVNFFGVVATIYAPGAGRIAAFNGYSAEGAGLGVFAGSSQVSVLTNAAALNQADGVWVQDANGQYQLLVIGGPAFLARGFEAIFNGGIGPNTAVTLVQTRTAPASAPATSTASGASSTYTVTAADTLSGIGVRFGVDWQRIAAANGIAGPNYLVRDGQTLTIPAR